ncbi:cupin [Chryseobacterium sp.]|uniref:cupin n=1 Tax=Chryseobacterium sp. TaxID=1871047 RepID=UPI002896D2B0|nr:cupin [Chryseobacterium sp.]
MEKASIFENIVYGDTKPAINVLLNTDSIKEVRIVFRKNQEMKEHKAGYPIVVDIVEGSIDFGVLGQRHLLNKGMLVALEASVPHDLIANEDSIVRLSLHKSDNISRVEQVIK